jgi:membrane carboxypeptidase/penicillin-binding protein
VFNVKADNDKRVDVSLDQLPSVDGALICLESKTGDVSDGRRL